MLLISSGCKRMHLLIIIQMPFDFLGGYHVVNNRQVVFPDDFIL
jgi:hypothetical protein